MADGLTVLQLDKVSQVGQSVAHLGVHIVQRGPLDGVLEELAGKGGVGGQSGIAAKGRLAVGAVAGDGGTSNGGDTGAGLGSVQAVAAFRGGSGAVGEISEQGLDVG